ncbi:putative beta-glucosidase I, partial [Lachnellula occidentalis]
VRSSAGGIGVQEEEIAGLVEDFLTFVHIKNPILHPDTLRSYARKVAENGPQWDSKSCLVYLTCALGCLAQAFELKGFSPPDPSTTQKRNSASHDNHKLRRAAAYYNIARKRIGLLVPSLITAHCVFFSGVYLMYNMQPLQGWYNFYQAATLTHMCLKSSTSTDEKTIRLEQCLYWSCFKSECEMGGELSFAVSALGTLEYPHLFPTPPSVPRLSTDRTSPHADTVSDSYSPAVSTPYSRRADSLITYDEDQSWYYYLTEIALRRIGNRVLNTFYKDGFMSWLNLSPQAISGMINTAKQFDDEILQRIDGLPDSLRSDHADMSASPPGELAHVVRARVIEIQNWLCRPFLFYAIHNPAHDILQEAIRPFVDRALQYAVRVVGSVAHRHRHHGTCLGTTACFLIIAAVRCGHITPPIEWEDLICRHISTLKYWESEAPDLASARLILERLLNKLRTDLMGAGPKFQRGIPENVIMASINVEDVLSKLTTREKVELLSGTDFWHTKAFPQYGVPSLRLSDGPNGVRGQRNFCGTPGAVLPCGTALGATWDQDLLFRAGKLMSDEGKAKGAHVILGPCINMQRGPLGGRGFESISEDPVLSGLSAAALTAGIQSEGLVACIKHFVCNDQEHQRNTYDALITERALREIYLRPFQLVSRDSKPGCYMTSYNKVNGVHASENKKLLQTTLRDEWGFDGVVLSDWFGTYSTSAAVKAGMDLEMPGPTRFRGNALGHAISCGKVSLEVLDDRARAMLKLVNRCAASGVKERAEEIEINTPETSSLLRKLATDSTVLLKNDNNVLPLSKSKTIVVIGPNAKVSTFCGGGSSALAPYYAITPYDGIVSKTSCKEVPFTVGAYSHKELPLLGPSLRTADRQIGVSFSAYLEPPTVSNSRERVDYKIVKKTDMFMFDYVCPKDTKGIWYATIEGYLTPDMDGEFELGLCVYGTAVLFVDGTLIIDNKSRQRQGTVFFGNGTLEEIGVISVKKGQTYYLKVEYASAATNKLGGGGVVRFGGGGVRIGGAYKIDPMEEINRAVELAKNADQVVVCAGLNADWEGEGNDRQDMLLPGYLDLLISRVAKSNPNTAVVLQAGSPVEMSWIDDVSSVVQAWYGGNECGNAIADVLFGDVNPSGKLSLSFPRRVKDNPTYLNYRSERGRTLYGEDIYVGYRYYEAVDQKVLFPFGHGLSYTTFSFSDLHITNDPATGVLQVSCSIKNTGSVPGAEVAQVYITQRNPSIRRPIKELVGFNKVFLQPGEERVVTIKMETKYAASFWDEGRNKWIVEKDKYDLLVGNSSALAVDSGDGTVLKGDFEVNETWWWKGL